MRMVGRLDRHHVLFDPVLGVGGLGDHVADEAGVDLAHLLDHVLGQGEHPELEGGAEVEHERGGDRGEPAHRERLTVPDGLGVLGEGAEALRPEIVQLHAVRLQEQLPALGQARVAPRGQRHRLALEVGELADVGGHGHRELPDVRVVVGHEERLVRLLALPGVGARPRVGEHGGHRPREVGLVAADLLHVDEGGAGLDLDVQLGELPLDHLGGGRRHRASTTRRWGPRRRRGSSWTGRPRARALPSPAPGE